MRIKSPISVALIGRSRFYLGIAVGLVFSTLSFGFFAYFKEVFRLRTLDSDFVVLTSLEYYHYNLFFAAISATAGFGFTVWTWFHGMRVSSRMPRRRLNYISAYAIFWSIGLMYVVAKGGTVLEFLFYDQIGCDGYMDWLRQMPELMVLMPTLAFVNIWTPIRLAFISGKWMITSIAAWIAWSAMLAWSFPVDPSELNKLAERKLAPYQKIVNEEAAAARSKGVLISEPALEAIKYNTKGRTIRQMIALKRRFAVKIKVPADSVVLALIIVKKTPVYQIPGVPCHGDDQCWPFVLPRHVYQQLKLTTDPIAKEYLEAILNEFDQIFNSEESDLTYEDIEEAGLWQKYANRDRLRGYYDIKSELGLYKSIDSANNEKEN